MAEKEFPRTEVSLKYMAWNIKEMAESVKAIAKGIDVLVAIKREDLAKMSQMPKKASNVVQDEFTFQE